MTSIYSILKLVKMFIFHGEIHDEAYPCFGGHFHLASGRPLNMEISNFDIKNQIAQQEVQLKMHIVA